MTAQTTNREQEIKAIWKDYAFFYRVLGGVILVGIGIFIGLVWFASELDRSAYVVNLYTTFLGAALTVFVIDLLNRRREKEEWKRRLIRQMYSPDNGLALQAVWELIAEGWTDDGSLKGKYFVNANLHDATLLDADLEKTVFTGANLTESDLPNANLQSAQLSLANLKGAKLWRANLRNSRLIGTNFEYAELVGVDLRGAYMLNAYLRYAKFTDDLLFDEIVVAILDETTTLPDRTHYDPEKGLTQLERFTNPEHPNFWEPEMAYGSWR